MRVIILICITFCFVSCKTNFVIYKYDITNTLSGAGENAYAVKYDGNNYKLIVPSNNYLYASSDGSLEVKDSIEDTSLLLELGLEIEVDSLNQRFIYKFEDDLDTIFKFGKSEIASNRILFENFFINSYSYSNKIKLLTYDSSYVFSYTNTDRHFFRNQLDIKTINYNVFPILNFNDKESSLPINVNIFYETGLPVFIRYFSIINNETHFKQMICSDYKIIKCKQKDLSKYLW